MPVGDVWGNSWGNAWNVSWEIVGVAAQDIIDTDVIQFPVNAVLMGTQPIKDRYREFDIRPMNMKTRGVGSRGQTMRLQGDKPSFTVTSSKKGHD